MYDSRREVKHVSSLQMELYLKSSRPIRRSGGFIASILIPKLFCFRSHILYNP